MLTQIKKIIFTILALGMAQNSLQATAINSTQLTTILQNNYVNSMFWRGNLPFLIQKATFGGVDVTSKVQYHAARGLLYIPNDGTQKMIQFTVYDKSNPTLSYNYQFNCTSFSLQKYTQSNDVTYSDFQSLNPSYVYILNNINGGKVYSYPANPGSIKNTQSNQYDQSIDVTTYMQNIYGNNGKIPVMNNLISNRISRNKLAYHLNFTLSIDGRALGFAIDYSN